MYKKSLQLYIPGNVMDQTDFHKWKCDSKYLEDDGVTTVKLYRCLFKLQYNCTAGLKVTAESDYIMIAR
jgi:hypothetical protein